MLLQAIESLMENKLEPISDGFVKIEKQLEKLEVRMDKFEEKMDNLQVKVEKIESRIHIVEKVQSEIKETQKTILDFVSEADFEFTRLDEKTKDMDKIKKIININNIV